MQSIKCVIVGDPDVGKTSLLYTYAMKEFPECLGFVLNYPDYSTDETRDGQSLRLELHDTYGQEDYDRLRPFNYPNTQVFLICFSVTDRISFENITEKWFPEVRHHCPKTPTLLVATKLDLRDQSTTASVTYSDGLSLATTIGAVNYLECSALKQIGVNEVFSCAIDAVLYPKKIKRSIIANTDRYVFAVDIHVVSGYERRLSEAKNSTDVISKIFTDYEYPGSSHMSDTDYKQII